jgi:hypothetical protein
VGGKRTFTACAPVRRDQAPPRTQFAITGVMRFLDFPTVCKNCEAVSTLEPGSVAVAAIDALFLGYRPIWN